jgi:hypothetical protein
MKSDERRIREALDRHDRKFREAWAAGGRAAALAAADDMLRALVALTARHELAADTEEHLEQAAVGVYGAARTLADEIRAALT